jgi:hypothetical protein
MEACSAFCSRGNSTCVNKNGAFKLTLMVCPQAKGASEVQYHELAATIENKYGQLDGVLHSAVELNAFTPLSEMSSG